MDNFKKLFTYLVVGALVIALSVSCKTNEDPTDNTHSNHPPSGTYSASWGGGITATATVTTSGGTCHITGTAYYDDTDSSYFDITITKWYQYNDSATYYAGSSYEQSEAAINSPSGVDFTVEYTIGNSKLSIWFGPSGKVYRTYTLERQQ